MFSVLGRYLGQIFVVVAIASTLTISYASVAFAPSATPKAAWAVNPISITFSALSGSASRSDSVSCAPSTGFVELRAKSSNPWNLALSATPPALSACGPSPSTITVTATCLVAAALCKGSYNGQIQVRQSGNYRNLPEVLKVSITVS